MSDSEQSDSEQSDSERSTGERVQRRVRFGLVDWIDRDARTNRDTVHYGYRDQVVELPASEAGRLDELGAVVEPETELARLGTLSGLPQAATDEQIIAYVRAASPSELKALYRERPDLGLRLDGARRRVFDTAAEADRALQRAQEVRDGGEVSEPLDASAYDDIVLRRPELRSQSSAPGAPLVDASAIVEGNAEDVADYVSEHPEHAAAILDAETRNRDGKPRQLVVKAVEAASAHTAQ